MQIYSRMLPNNGQCASLEEFWSHCFHAEIMKSIDSEEIDHRKHYSSSYRRSFRRKNPNKSIFIWILVRCSTNLCNCLIDLQREHLFAHSNQSALNCCYQWMCRIERTEFNARNVFASVTFPVCVDWIRIKHFRKRYPNAASLANCGI